MIHTEIILTIIGMAIVTYTPRLIPAIFIGKIKLSKKFEKFLKLIPYTAMAALIFPGILEANSDNVLYGIVGGITAIILGLIKCPLMLCVLAAIFSNFIMYMCL